MGRPQECNPCCGRQRVVSDPGYCTHRRYDDAGSSGTLIWSHNINPSLTNRSAVYAMTVGDDGTVYSAGTLDALENTHSVIEARDPDGTFLWRKGVEAAIEDLALSGGALWAVGAKVREESTAPNVFKLDPSDGSLLWSGHLTVASYGGHITRPHAVIPDESGGVYVGGGSNPDGAAGFIVRLSASGSKVSEWPAGAPAQGITITGSVADLVLLDGDLFVAGGFTGTKCTGGPFVPPWRGPLLKMSTSYVVEWIRTGQGTLGPGVAVDATASSVYLGFRGGCIWKIDPSSAEVSVSKSVSGVVDGANPCAGINDLVVSSDDSTVYVANGQHLVAMDAGTLDVAWCEKHGGVIDGEEVSCCYYAVAAGSTGTSPAGQIAYAGGCAAGCDPSFLSPAPSCSATTCASPSCSACYPGPLGGMQSAQCNAPCKEIPCIVQMPFRGFGCFEGIAPTLVPMVFMPTEAGQCRWVGSYTFSCTQYAGTPDARTIRMKWNFDARETSGTSCSGWSMHVTVQGLDGTCNLPAKDATILDCSCDHTDASTGIYMGHPWFDWSVYWTPEELNSLTCPCCDGTVDSGIGTPPASGVDLCGCTGTPETLTASISGMGCCLDGVSVTLTWDAANSWWYGSSPASGCASGNLILKLYCSGGAWALDGSHFCIMSFSGAGLTGSCLPLTYAGMTSSGFCGCVSGGTLTITA